MPAKEPFSSEHFSEQEWRFGYWYVTHKVQLRKTVTISLAVITTLLWLFVVGMLIKIYLIEDTHYRAVAHALTQQVPVYTTVHDRGAQQLILKPLQTYAGAEGTTDYVLDMTNPNPAAWVRWTGQLTGVNASTTPHQEFLLPGETRPFGAFGIPQAQRSASAQYTISDVHWYNIDRHLIADIPAYIGQRSKFSVSSTSFFQTPSEKGTVSRVHFLLSNDSAYSYWNVRATVRLYRGSAVTAVVSTDLTQLRSGETREVDMSWVQDLPGISRVEVLPAVNVFDPSAYMR